MATIYFEITAGTPPFTATLREANPPFAIIQTLAGIGIGIHNFTNVPDGEYNVWVEDALGCLTHFPVDITCITTTTIFCDVYAEIIIGPIPTTTSTTSSTTSTTSSTSSTTTSSTSSSTTTSTTTSFDILYCNTEFNQEGRQTYPDVPTATIILGVDTGYVQALFTPIEVPDRLMIKYEGNWVVDTGYTYTYFPWSPSRYNYGESYRYKVENALNGKIDPLSGLTYPITGANLIIYQGAGYDVFPNIIAPDGYPNVYMSYTGYTWNKLTPTTECEVYVFAPIVGTAWILKVKCPTDIYPTTTSTTSSSTSSTTTTSTTIEINTLFVYYDVL